MKLVQKDVTAFNGVTYISAAALSENGDLALIFDEVCEKIRARLPKPEKPDPDAKIVPIGSKLSRDVTNIFRYPPKDIPEILAAFRQARSDRLEGIVWAGRAYNNIVCETVTQVLRERSGINYQVL